MGLIIFDCDGVLVDSEPIAHGLLAQMMTDLGHPMSTAESVQKFTGRSLADTLPRIEDVLGRSIPDQIGQRYRRLLLEHLRRDLKPIAGVKEAVAMLRYPRCVASSSRRTRSWDEGDWLHWWDAFKPRCRAASRIGRCIPHRFLNGRTAGYCGGSDVVRRTPTPASIGNGVSGAAGY